MPQQFPTELLIQISEYLSPREKRVGLVICRGWYESFLYTLYRDIYILNVDQLNLLCKTLKTQNIYHLVPYGYLVKRLYLKNTSDPFLIKSREKLIMPRDVFEQLPTLCPYLELLDFDPESWKHISYNVSLCNWECMKQLPTLECLGTVFPILKSIGQGLTHLSIFSSMIIDVSTTNRISVLLKTVPNLRSLVIKSNLNSPGPKLTITLEDVEVVHRLLPNLENLEFSGDCIQMPLEFNKATLDQISTVTICARMHTAHLNTFFTSPLWLFYVARKYPNVQYLTVGVHDETNDSVTHNYTEFYIALIQKCKHLSHLQINCSQIYHWLNAQFFEALDQTCIRKIQPVVQSNNYINTDTELDVALQYGGKLITALELAQWRFDRSLSVTISLLKKLTNLNYLELKCDSYNDEYEMNILLASCPVLETLVLEWGTLCITNDKRTDNHRHPLSSLRITYVGFGVSFFATLSERCPLLSRILISRCKQISDVNDITSQSIIKLDVPKLSLDLVSINGLRLDSSNMSSFYHGLSSYTRIMSIEEIETASEERWYHHIGYKENNRKLPLLKRLNSEDQKALRNYFEKRMKLEPGNATDNHVETISKQITDEALKANVMSGYIQLRCKSLENFVLDGNINCMFFYN